MTKATEWAARLEAWRASGKSAADFCTEHGYSAKNLVWWSSHFRRKAKPATKGKRMILARVVRRREPTRPAAAAIVVRVGNALVEVVGGVDRAALSLVFETLVAATVRRG